MGPFILGAAAIGGLASLINNLIKSKSQQRQNRMMNQGNGFNGMNVQEGLSQLPKFNQQQNQGLQQILSSGLQGLQQTPFNFGPIRQNALNSFHSNIVPSIAERFAGSSRRSSGLEGAIGAAGAGLESNLAAQEQGFNLQNRNQLMQLLQLGLQSPYEYLYKDRQPGFGENASVAALPSLIQYAPQLAEMFSQWGAQGQAGGK